ncbi:MAG: site-specific integrase [Xanthomonadaceae bacterium]|nr:site-specific integrase [Xanthomonadaceae bacterium]MDE1964546.1 site-specific integrase [Xanthomonadaceae bacterium]
MFALLSVLRRLNDRGLAALTIPRYSPFDESDNARQFVFTAEQERELFNRIKHLDATESKGRPRVLDAHAYHDLFVFLADTGCRLTAALNVRWTDVFTDNGATFVRFFRKQHLKGGRPRTTPLTKRAAEALNRQEKGGTEGPFTMLNKRRAQHLWMAARAQTSFAYERDAVIHSLRHTCATRMLLATGDIKLVQDWLGHSSIQTTAQTYAKVLTKQKVAALTGFQTNWND